MNSMFPDFLDNIFPGMTRFFGASISAPLFQTSEMKLPHGIILGMFFVGLRLYEHNVIKYQSDNYNTYRHYTDENKD